LYSNRNFKALRVLLNG